MAYQNVATPRFYVNVLEWLGEVGQITLTTDHFRTLPVVLKEDTTPITAENIPSGAMGDKNFLAVLGHVLGDSMDLFGVWDLEESIGSEGTANIINGDGGEAEYNGFSIISFNNAEAIISSGGSILFIIEGTQEFGSVIIGSYYDMPNAPNLSLTMSREYGGIKEFTTYNGSSMSNTMWSKPPKWGDLGAWELGSGNPALSRSGRRSWDLKFSYMADSDLWGSNQSLSFLDVANNMEFDYNLLTDDNFFSQVWHKTLGGTLPFIFQPDNSNNNPDQFAICKFKDSSLKADQSAFNVYDISLSIEEVW